MHLQSNHNLAQGPHGLAHQEMVQAQHRLALETHDQQANDFKPRRMRLGRLLVMIAIVGFALFWFLLRFWM